MGALIHNLYLVSSNELNIDRLLPLELRVILLNQQLLRYFPVELLWLSS